jgi:hypothetical protein
MLPEDKRATMRSLSAAFLFVVLGVASVYAQVAAPQPPSVNIAGAAEVTFWQTIVNSTNPQDFRDYLTTFPTGAFAILAKRKLAMFETLNLDGTIWIGHKGGSERRLAYAGFAGMGRGVTTGVVLVAFTGGNVYWRALIVYTNKKHPERNFDEPTAATADAAQVAAGKETFDEFVDKYFAGQKAHGTYTTTAPNVLNVQGYDDNGCTGPGAVYAGTITADTLSGSYTQQQGTGSLLFGNPCPADSGSFELKRQK